MSDEGTAATLSVEAPDTGAHPAHGTATEFVFQTGNNDRIAFDKIIPEEYKSKEWVQNVLKSDNPQIEFFKQFENAQSLIGQKSQGLQVPGDDATPEQRQAFYKALGVPDDIKAYEITPTEWADDEKDIGAYLAETRGEEFHNALKAAAKEIGITPKQFDAMNKAYDKAFVVQHKAALAEVAKAEAEADADFETKVSTLFGARKEQAVAAGAKVLSKAPEHIKPLLTSDPLVGVAALLDWVNATYVKEDSLSTQGATSGSTQASLQGEAQKLMALPAYSDFTHVDHRRTVDRVNQIYDQLFPNSKKR